MTCILGLPILTYMEFLIILIKILDTIYVLNIDYNEINFNYYL